MSEGDQASAHEGLIFDVDSFAVHDGPGIRMAIYFKGCPLACRWCHSPESQRSEPQLIFLGDRCVRCGACQAACERGVHRVGADGHAITWEACAACGACAEHCIQHALGIKGYVASLAALLDKARHLKPFFQHSGGGVTLTGGEVTMQADFAAALLAGLHELGIHTAIETCGACGWPRLAKVARHADLVLYDIKLIDDEAHRHWTGVSNGQILRNAARLAGRNVQVRVPLIPGITDTEENVRGIYLFVKEAGLPAVALLPYNPSAGAKYQWLGHRYEIEGEVQAPAQLERLAGMGREMGLVVQIG